MKSNLKYYRIPYGAAEWDKFRTIGIDENDAKKFKCEPYEGGIGASECGCILGLSKWRPVSGELYSWKVGMTQPNKIDNEAMLMGRILQPVVRDIWRCYDGTPIGWVSNYNIWKESVARDRSKQLVRDAHSINAYIVNPKYPYLFASLDYYTEKGTPDLLDGMIYNDGFPLEVKTIYGYYANQWEGGVPPNFLAQVNQQMIITDAKYSELAILIDGRKFKVMPCKRDDVLCDRIISYGKAFWDRVLEAREAKKNMDKLLVENDLENASHQKAIIDSNEPEPDDSEAYTAYLKERHTRDIKSVDGTMQDYKLCQDDQMAKELIKALESKRTFIENQLLAKLVDTGAEEINFGAAGKFTYLENKKGTKIKDFSILISPPKHRIEEEISKINFKY